MRLVPRRCIILLAALPLLLLGAATGAVTHAQSAPYPVVLTMTGPLTAASGQEVAYRLHYRLTDPSTLPQAGFSIGFNINIALNTTYVSTGVVSGVGVLHLTEEYVVWGVTGNAEETEGEVELTVKIDGNYVGSIFESAYVPGTETTGSNVVETQVFAPGTLPKAGDGAKQGDSEFSRVAALIALLGAALICTGAVTRRRRRAR